MNIIITGGAGFVGSNLCIDLKMKYGDYNITALDNLKRRGSELNLIRFKEAGVNFVHGDIRNAEDLLEFEHADFIIDASADPSVLAGITSPIYSVFSNNLIGTINCLELASKFNASFLFLSTSRIYPIKNLENCNYEELETRFQWTDNQTLEGVSSQGIKENFPLDGSRSFYGASKLASELIIKEYNELKGMKAVINRCGVISGPWQMGKVDQGVLVLWMARHFFKGKLNYIGYNGTGKQLRDVIHIKDLVCLVDWQIHNINLVNGQTFNIGGGLGVSFSLAELTQACRELTGNKIEITPVDETRIADLRIYITDCTKVNEWGWYAEQSLEMLLSDTFHWIKENEKRLKYILK